MIRIKTIYLALLAVLLAPMTVSADLIQQATADADGNGFPDTSFGTLIFPNEFQNPFGGNPTCILEANPASVLPLCEIGEFLPDKANFGPFEQVGVEIADSAPLLGFWEIVDGRVVPNRIYAVSIFNLGDDYGVFTVVFGRFGNICATVQDEQAAFDCFTINADGGDAGVFAYQLDPVHSVPEPGTLALLGLGLVGMAARRRKKV